MRPSATSKYNISPLKSQSLIVERQQSGQSTFSELFEDIIPEPPVKQHKLSSRSYQSNNSQELYKKTNFKSLSMVMQEQIELKEFDSIDLTFVANKLENDMEKQREEIRSLTDFDLDRNSQIKRKNILSPMRMKKSNIQ
ncbi:Hypothetical_protein [Hexamita inflata]|uniref:Hypothetical_protein n=1 Tax=Hexamita inflata TaxID=28002 RepID=A0AA86N869_9EUKA|nr:Hypothetical protein HINF_LOCUS1834 [Hexamita inflata]